MTATASLPPASGDSPRPRRKREYTPEDLLQMENGKIYELVDGQLEELSMGAESGVIALRIAVLLVEYAKSFGGLVLNIECPLQIFPGHPRKVRRPDAALVRSGRLPADRAPKGTVTVAPDIIVEVISPGDRAANVETKVGEYLEAGVRLVWLIYPEARTAHVRRSDGTTNILDATCSLSGEDVAPGLSIALRDVLPAPE